MHLPGRRGEESSSVDSSTIVCIGAMFEHNNQVLKVTSVCEHKISVESIILHGAGCEHRPHVVVFADKEYVAQRIASYIL